jgi:uncharacterized protein YcnI
MKSLIKLASLINSDRQFSRSVILTLTLTSLLFGGIGCIDNNSGVAAPTIEQTQISQNSQRLPQKIARAILSDASRLSGVAIANLKITQAKSQTFGNPCVFKFGEICTREYRPIRGWEVIVKVKDQSWTYHVNLSGTQIVLDPKVEVSANTQLPQAIANKVLSDAAKRSGVAIANLKINQAKSQTFGNSCEFSSFGGICPQIYEPVAGWVVTVQVKGQSWTYHVNKSGSQIVLDPAIIAQIS